MNPIIITLIGIVVLLAVFGKKSMMKFNEIVWSKEKPGKVIGLRVRLARFDGLGPNPPEELSGSINDFKEGVYRINFDEAIVIDGKKETYASVSARHVGHPVSRVNKRGILAVNGRLESGRGFIALIAKK